MSNDNSARFWSVWNNMRARLNEKFPHAFVKSKQPRYALKRGIHKDICSEMNGEYSMNEIKAFLKVWCNRKRYLKAVVQNYSPRIDLQGFPHEPITDEERIVASNRIAKIVVKSDVRLVNGYVESVKFRQMKLAEIVMGENKEALELLVD